MEVRCPKCDAEYNIPDDRLPKGKVVQMTCAKCKSKIPIDTRAKGTMSIPADHSPDRSAGTTAAQYNAEDKPFDYVEHGAMTALVCESDPAMRATIKTDLESEQCAVTVAESARDALKQMRFHVFGLVVINENFDTEDPDNNHVLKYIARLPIVIRRQMFIALLTDRFRTNDNMAAFTKSANVVVNMKNANDIEKILKGAMAEHEDFSKMFFQTMKKFGKL